MDLYIEISSQRYEFVSDETVNYIFSPFVSLA
jgi:hypothetical protein